MRTYYESCLGTIHSHLFSLEKTNLLINENTLIFEKTNIGDTEKESEGGFLFFDLTKFSVGSVILPQGTQRFTQGTPCLIDII